MGRTVVGAAGVINFPVPADTTLQNYEVAVLGPTGGIEGQLDFQVIRDQVAPVIALPLPPKATVLPDIETIGTAGDTSEMNVNGIDFPLADEAFELVVALAPELNVFNPVENVTATRLPTRFDIETPDEQRVSVTRPPGEAGPMEIMVSATGASGLRQRREPLPRNISGEPGTLQLIEVIVQDDAGNAAFRPGIIVCSDVRWLSRIWNETDHTATFERLCNGDALCLAIWRANRLRRVDCRVLRFVADPRR